MECLLSFEAGRGKSRRMTGPEKFHVPALDGVRGIALLIVMAAHTQPQLLRGGNIGVDLFFVLSGFLITSILLREHASTGTISIPKFYGRRALRLFPALFVMVVIVVAYTWAFLPSMLETTVANAKAVLLYYWNWYAAFEWGPQTPNYRHLWSLSVEEQFYIGWPLILLLTLDRPRIFLALLVFGIVAPAAGRIMLWERGPSLHLYFRTDLRFDNLMWGAGAAWIVFHRRSIPFMTVLGAAAFVAFLVMARFDLLSNGFLYLGGYSLIGLMGALIVASGVAATPRWLGAVLEFRPLQWTGKISYGLYLWHVPIFHVCADLPIGSLARNLVAIAATYAVAALSYYSMERYFLGLKPIGSPPTLRQRQPQPAP